MQDRPCSLVFSLGRSELLPVHDADDENDAVLFEKIKKGEYDADDPIWDQVSLPAKDLVVSHTSYRIRRQTTDKVSMLSGSRNRSPQHRSSLTITSCVSRCQYQLQLASLLICSAALLQMQWQGPALAASITGIRHLRCHCVCSEQWSSRKLLHSTMQHDHCKAHS